MLCTTRLIAWIRASRLARWLFQAEGVLVDWSAKDWSILRKMGKGVKEGLTECGLKTYEDAVRLCGLISSATGEPYALDSLACFLCLASRGSSGRGSELRLPERPRPVTIAADLEMGASPTLWPQPIDRHAAASGAGALPDLRHFVRMSGVILCLDNKTHFALRQCGRGTCLAGGVPQPLARTEQLYYWVARLLHVDGPHAVEMQRRGVSKGRLTRAVACAWDWLDALKGERLFHSLWRDPFVGAVVVVRVALKFELTDSQQPQALRLYRRSIDHSQVLTLETRVLQALPARM